MAPLGGACLMRRVSVAPPRATASPPTIATTFAGCRALGHLCRLDDPRPTLDQLQQRLVDLLDLVTEYNTEVILRCVLLPIKRELDGLPHVHSDGAREGQGDQHRSDLRDRVNVKDCGDHVLGVRGEQDP